MTGTMTNLESITVIQNIVLGPTYPWQNDHPVSAGLKSGMVLERHKGSDLLAFCCRYVFTLIAGYFFVPSLARISTAAGERWPFPVFRLALDWLSRSSAGCRLVPAFP